MGSVTNRKCAVAETRIDCAGGNEVRVGRRDGGPIGRAAAPGCAWARTTELRVWHAHGLKPHRVQSSKLSNDPHCAEKLEDIVGRCMAPPKHALVLCCNETSEIEVLDRIQPGLPMSKGRAASMTHECKCHGVTTLFAALKTLEVTVIAHCKPQQLHDQWQDLLRLIDRRTPKGHSLHLICDTCHTHKHPKVKAWLEKLPRAPIHFTPTTASWMNMVEHCLRSIRVDRLRNAVFKSVNALVKAI